MASTKQTGGGVWLVGIIWILAVLAAVMALVAARQPQEGVIVPTGPQALMQSMLWLAALLALTGLGLAFLFNLIYLAKVVQSSEALVADMRKMVSGQTHMEAVLTQVSENLLLSDKIKTVAFREKDRMVLREAIEEDMRMERWDSAQVLIQELEDRFGSRQDAEELREQMKRLQSATRQEKIDAAVKHIESLWMIHHYDDAEREVTSLVKLYPNVDKVQVLIGQTQEKREAHKKELLARWDKAVKENDIDQGVELLKLLDGYLTPTEAAALEESARGVFRAKLHNMGVQFSLFVTEKKWQQALKIGRQIIEEYPNSRMAQEVRDKLDVLEQKAAE